MTVLFIRFEFWTPQGILGFSSHALADVDPLTALGVQVVLDKLRAEVGKTHPQCTTMKISEIRRI